MKNKCLLLIAVLCMSVAMFPVQMVGQTEAGNSINPEMSLTIGLEKDTYLEWEPIIVRSRFENQTTKALTSLVPSIINEGSIVIESEKEKREFGELSIYRSLLARRPVTFTPGQGFDEEFTLERALDEFFPRAGQYSMRVVLNTTDGRRIVSNPVDITIDAASGIDKEALAFIKKNKVHSYYPVLFSWKGDVRTDGGKTLLEEFVSKYSHSVYGDYGVYQLGSYYLARREFDKARIELNKVKNSSVVKIAKDARQKLSDVDKGR